MGVSNIRRILVVSKADEPREDLLALHEVDPHREGQEVDLQGVPDAVQDLAVDVAVEDGVHAEWFSFRLAFLHDNQELLRLSLFQCSLQMGRISL